MRLISRENRIKFRNILIIVFLGIGFGTFYNYLFYPHNFTEFAEAISISIIIGVVIGFTEEFKLKRFFQSISFYKVLIIRTLIYSLFTVLILSMVLSIDIAFTDNISYFEALESSARSSSFKRDFFFTLAFIFMIIFLAQVVQLIGINNLLRLISGRYHKPSEIERVFMFVDLNDSTTIAEEFGDKKYSAFIREYFNDVSKAITIYRGEIYQYVGDEISIVWPARKNNDHCLKCFFKIDEIISKKKDHYLEKFGRVPEYKSGIHVGQTLVTEVGEIRKELVYHGDTINTTSRIIGKCKTLNQRLLISGELEQSVDHNKFEIVEKGEMILRGKSHTTKLFAVLKRY